MQLGYFDRWAARWLKRHPRVQHRLHQRYTNVNQLRQTINAFARGQFLTATGLIVGWLMLGQTHLMTMFDDSMSLVWPGTGQLGLGRDLLIIVRGLLIGQGIALVLSWFAQMKAAHRDGDLHQRPLPYRYLVIRGLPVLGLQLSRWWSTTIGLFCLFGWWLWLPVLRTRDDLAVILIGMSVMTLGLWLVSRFLKSVLLSGLHADGFDDSDDGKDAQ